MIRSPATLRAPILPVSRYSTMSGAIKVESIRTRTGASVSLRIWCAPSLPRGNATTSPWRSCCSPSCVRSVGSPRRTIAHSSFAWWVKRPLLVTRLDLVHARADQLGVGVRADPGVLETPALALFRAIPLVCVEIEDLHAASLVRHRLASRRGSWQLFVGATPSLHGPALPSHADSAGCRGPARAVRRPGGHAWLEQGAALGARRLARHDRRGHRELEQGRARSIRSRDRS